VVLFSLGGKVCWLIGCVGGRWLAVKGKLASLVASARPPTPATLDSQPPTAFGMSMSQHTSPSRQPKLHRRQLPQGRAKLQALEVAVNVVAAINELHFRRGSSHLRDHLIRAADNTALRLSEASGRTMGNRYQHLEAAYSENQEVQTDLTLLRVHGVDVPISLSRQADRLGGLIFGLLRAEARAQGS
jgi:four helix bundle protein